MDDRPIRLGASDQYGGVKWRRVDRSLRCFEGVTVRGDFSILSLKVRIFLPEHISNV